VKKLCTIVTENYVLLFTENYVLLFTDYNRNQDDKRIIEIINKIKTYNYEF